MITTADKTEWIPTNAKLVGSVPKVRSRDVSRPAKIGEYPVFIEQSGSYRMFTYNYKLTSL